MCVYTVIKAAKGRNDSTYSWSCQQHRFIAIFPVLSVGGNCFFFFAPELLRYLCLSFAIGRWCQEQSTVISVRNGDNFDRFKLNTDPSCLF